MPGMASFSSSMAPFLYQTRTIQRHSFALTRSSTAHLVARTLHTSQPRRDGLETQFLEKFASIHDKTPDKKKKKAGGGGSRRNTSGPQQRRNGGPSRSPSVLGPSRPEPWADDYEDESSPDSDRLIFHSSKGRKPRPMGQKDRRMDDDIEDPWWQVAGLQDTAIAQPPMLGAERSSNVADYRGSQELAPFGSRQETPSFGVRQAEPGDNRAPEMGTDFEGSGWRRPQRHVEFDGGKRDAVTESAGRNISIGQNISIDGFVGQEETEADKIWEEYGDGTGQDEPAPPEGDGVGAEAWSDSGWVDKTSGPMELPEVPQMSRASSSANSTFPDTDAGLKDPFATMIPPEPKPREYKRRERPSRLPSWIPQYMEEPPSLEDIPWENAATRAAKATQAEIADNDYSNAAPIPFDFDIKTDDNLRGQRSPLSTLTVQERSAFSKIWDEIILFNHRPRVKANIDAKALTAPSSEEEGSVPAVKSEEEVKESAESAVRFLIKDAAFTSFQGSDSVNGGTIVDQMRNVKYRETVLKNYPTSVREVAVKALGLHAMPHGRDGRSRILNLADIKNNAEDPDVVLRRIKAMGLVDSKVEERRQTEWNRIKDLLTSAPTDKALWDVLEEHVFTIPGRLGIEEVEEEGDVEAIEGSEEDVDEVDGKAADVEESDSEAVGEAGEETSELRESESESESSPPAAPLPRLPMDVYGPVYPALLIAAHRQLVRNFSPSSPLVFNLLPRVKSISLASYVLGASTTLYNETMSLWWTHRGDLRAVLSMIDEMDAAGLYADSHTEKLLDRINTTLRVCGGGGGVGGGWTGFVPSMLQMGGFSAGVRKRLAQTHARVRNSVQQRGILLLK